MVGKQINKRPLSQYERALILWIKRAYKGSGYTMATLAEDLGMNLNTFSSRMRRGDRLAETFVRVCLKIGRFPRVEEVEELMDEA